MNELANLYERMAKVEQGNAICMDRTERHDGQIAGLERDVHQIRTEVTSIRGTVEYGFRDTAEAHKRMMGEQEKAASELRKLASSVAAVNGKQSEWVAIGGFVLLLISAGGGVAGLLKAFGVLG